MDSDQLGFGGVLFSPFAGTGGLDEQVLGTHLTRDVDGGPMRAPLVVPAPEHVERPAALPRRGLELVA